MKINILSILFLGVCGLSNAQVGINTTTPTEKLDVNGTLRVRSLPNDGAPNSIYTTSANTNSGATPTQTFKANRPLVSDANGVVGQTTTGDLVPNNTLTGFGNTTTPDSSKAYFVMKRYSLKETISGMYVTTPFDTGMSVDNWQAIMSNVSWKFIGDSTGAQFIDYRVFNYRLQGAAGSTWKITGDIINVLEEGYVDVLFIKSSIVAADDRFN